MALGRVGLEAVLVLSSFERDQKRYEAALDSMQRKTEAAAKKMADSGKAFVLTIQQVHEQVSKWPINKIQEFVNRIHELRQKSEAALEAFTAAERGAGAGAKILVTGEELQIRAFREIQEEAGRATTAVHGFGGATDDAGRRGVNFALSLFTLRYAVMLVQAAFRELKQAYDSIAETAALVDMKNAFVNLAASSGIASRQLIADMQAVAQGTLDTRTIILAANRALLAGGAAFAEDLPELMEIAMAAARATGKTFEYTFDSIVKGIARGSPKLIDNAEIYIRLGNVIEEYARQNDIAVESISAQGRMEITRAAVLEKGARAVEAMGGAMGEASRSFRALNTQWTDFTTGVEQQALPAVQELNNRLIVLVTTAKAFYSLIVAGNMVIRAASMGIFDLNTLLDVAVASFGQTFAALSGVVPELDEMTEAQRRAAGAAIVLTDAEDELNRVLGEQQEKVDDLKTQYDERYARIQQQHYDRLEDMQRSHERQIEDAEIALARRREDIASQRGRKLEDLIRNHERKLADIRKGIAEKVQEFIDDANKKREDLEIKHQQRLQDIQLRYQDTIEEAARSNDAVAVVRAMRQRQRDLRDADLARQREAQSLERTLAEKREQINRDADTRRQDEIERYEEALADQREAERRQEEDLQLSLRRQEEDRQRSWQRQEDDRVASYIRQMAELQRWFTDERIATEAHYVGMISTAEQAVIDAGNVLAVATATAIATISAAALVAAASEIGGAVLRQFQREREASGLNLEEEIGGSVLRRWYRRGEGGLDIVSRPTPFVMGERGPEAVLSVPLSGQVNVNHQFSRLGIDVNGIPGGMDMRTIQTMMWTALTHLAQQVTERR